MCNYKQQALIQRRRRTTDSTYNYGVDWLLMQQHKWGGDEIEVIQLPKRLRRFECVK